MRAKALIFGGTTEGRLLGEYAAAEHLPVYISVTSDYGQRLLPVSEYVQVLKEPLKEEKMIHLFREKEIKMVIDATHPYAVDATKNIRGAAKQTNTVYYRLLREEEMAWGKKDKYRYFDSAKEVVDYLCRQEGDIFVAVGSKELEQFARLKQARRRCVLRVLDEERIVAQCVERGFDRERIITGRGPFEEKKNKEDFSRFPCRFLVTKDSGKTGGFGEKCRAALELGMEILVIRRPVEEGYGLERIKILLKNFYFPDGEG